MADIKQIEFAIKGNDLASKPLTEIGAAIAKLVTAVGEIVPASEHGEKNLSELTATADQLKAALKSLAADQAVIDQFASLSAQIAETTSKLTGLKGRADAAKVALANAVVPTSALRKEAQSAATAVNAQDRALTAQVARLDRLKVTAASAGIDLNNLAASQLKVDSAFATAAPAYNRANVAIGQYAANQKKAATAAREHAEAEKLAAAKIEASRKAMELFTGKAPSLIGLFQRMRESVIGLVVAYAGFAGAIEQVKSGFEAIEKLEGTKSILATTFGGEKEAADQLKYVAAQADRLGLKYIDLAGNYAKFTAAAVSQGVSVENARQVFETFAEAARVKNISADGQTTIFAALEKIMAKDTVAAGDLFKKLTAELPDVAAEFRKAFGDGSLNTEQFDKLIKSGKLTSDMLIGLAARYRDTFSKQLPGATATTTAQLAKFGNAIDQLKIRMLEGGALQVFADGLKKITVYLRSDDGQKFADTMANGLKRVADGFVFLIDHIGAVKVAVEALAAVWIFRSAFGLYTDLKKIAEAFSPLLTGSVKLLTTEINAASIAALKLGGILKGLGGLVGAGFAGWEIGTWLYDNLSGIRVAGAAVVGSFDILWETIKGRGKLAWAAIFDHSNYAAQAAAFDKAQAKRVADFKDQMRDAGRNEDGASLPAATGPEAGAADKPHTESAADAAARTKAEIAVQMGLIDEAAKGVANHLGELRGELARKNATELQAFIIGLDQQLKPVRDEIAKLSTYGKNADATVAKLRAGLAAYRSDALKAEQGTLDEHSAAKQYQDINELLRIRSEDIKAENDLTRYGAQSEATAQQHISDIMAKSNIEVRARVMALQGFIATLPAGVQAKLHEVVNSLKVTTAQLNEIPAVNVVTVMTAEVEKLNRQLELRAAKLEAIKQLEAVHAISAADALTQEKAIAAQYEPIVRGAKAYAEILLHSEALTKEQREELEKVAIQLQITATKAGAVKDALYSAEQVDKDLASGLTGVAAAFAKVVGQGHFLKSAFHAAADAFKKFAADFIMKIAQMIIQAQILKALQGTGIGSGISGLVGAATVSHMGGMAGAGVPRRVMSQWFENAPRYHSGGVAGLDQNEVPAILQRGEEVLSKNDARNAANGGKQSTPQHIQVVNAMDHESIVREGLNAPSNTKVILNMIRANRGAVRQALT
jgi:Tape measure protein